MTDCKKGATPVCTALWFMVTSERLCSGSVQPFRQLILWPSAEIYGLSKGLFFFQRVSRCLFMAAICEWRRTEEFWQENLASIFGCRVSWVVVARGFVLLWFSGYTRDVVEDRMTKALLHHDSPSPQWSRWSVKAIKWGLIESAVNLNIYGRIQEKQKRPPLPTPRLLSGCLLRRGFSFSSLVSAHTLLTALFFSLIFTSPSN